MREILPKPLVKSLVVVNALPVERKRKTGKIAAKPPPSKPPALYRKKKITGALREAVWIKTLGKRFEGKCPVTWCSNTITVFDFQSGHNIPESKGGETKLPNLIAICARCNFSMGNTYTIDEWNILHASSTTTTISDNLDQSSISTLTPVHIDVPMRQSFWKRMFSCFVRQ